jgi:hypothetical protein
VLQEGGNGLVRAMLDITSKVFKMAVRLPDAEGGAGVVLPLDGNFQHGTSEETTVIIDEATRIFEQTFKTLASAQPEHAAQYADNDNLRLIVGASIHLGVTICIYRHDTRTTTEVYHPTDANRTIRLHEYENDEGQTCYNLKWNEHYVNYDNLFWPVDNNMWPNVDPSRIEFLQMLFNIIGYGPRDHMSGAACMIAPHLLETTPALKRIMSIIPPKLVSIAMAKGFLVTNISHEQLGEVEAEALEKLDGSSPGGYLRVFASTNSELDSVFENIELAGPDIDLRHGPALFQMAQTWRQNNPDASDDGSPGSIGYVGMAYLQSVNDRLTGPRNGAEKSFFDLVPGGQPTHQIPIFSADHGELFRCHLVEAFVAGLFQMASNNTLCTLGINRPLQYQMQDGSGGMRVNGGVPHFLQHRTTSRKQIYEWIFQNVKSQGEALIFSDPVIPPFLQSYASYLEVPFLLFAQSREEFVHITSLQMMTLKSLQRCMADLGNKAKVDKWVDKLGLDKNDPKHRFLAKSAMGRHANEVRLGKTIPDIEGRYDWKILAEWWEMRYIYPRHTLSGDVRYVSYILFCNALLCDYSHKHIYFLN